MKLAIPNSSAELTAPLLDAIIAERHPGVRVEGVEVLDVRELGQEVSTAGRVKIGLSYGNSRSSLPNAPQLPRKALVKMVIDEPGAPDVCYETEVMIHKKFLPELDVEMPLCLGAEFDAESGRFLLVLEDLSEKQAHFPNVLMPALEPSQVSKLLEWLAKLHATFWESPKLREESHWLSSLTEGPQFDFMDAGVVNMLDVLVEETSYRKDLITRVGRSPAQLWANVKAVHRHHENIFPMTLNHGDTGAHNSYHLPDGRCGFLDWQLSVRSAWPHDVHYLICTALSVASRRAHERSLLQHYLDKLSEYGVRDVPPIDLAMREMGRAIIWGFTVGWLLVPERNYGMEIISTNLERLYAAALDHDTFALADEVM